MDGKTNKTKEPAKAAQPEHKNPFDDVSIFAITPTYVRLTQKVDLTSLCYTIQNIPNIVWIMVEDSTVKTDLVDRVLKRCKVHSVWFYVDIHNYCKLCNNICSQFICVLGRFISLHM